MKKRFLITAVFIAAFALSSGCSDYKGIFSKHDKKPAEGTRISILQNGSDLKANDELKSTAINLPQAWNNELWPQTGGYPNHAMGQLELNNKRLKKVWSAYIGDKSYDFNPLIIQPIVVKHTVFTLDNKSTLSAFKLADGERKWRFSLKPNDSDSGLIGGGIAYAAGKLFITNGFKELYCVNPDTGKLVWKIQLPEFARSAPTADDEKVYLTTIDNRLNVFSVEDGKALWSYTGIASTTNLLGSAAPAVDPSIAVLPLPSGDLVGLRPLNGQTVWGDNLSATTRTDILFSISDVRGLPVIDQGIVFASSFSGRMVAIDEVSGQRLWQRNIGSSETPWSAGDAVFVISNEQQMIALNRNNGGIYWMTPLQTKEKSEKKNAQVWKGPVFAGGRLITVSNKGKVAEINPADGKIMGTYDIGDGAVVSPVVANGTLLFLTSKGELIAYR